MRGCVVQRLDLAKADVLAGGGHVAHKVLKDHADRVAQAVRVILAQVDAIQQNLALVRVIQPRQQLDKRGLARAVCANQRQLFAGLG